MIPTKLSAYFRGVIMVALPLLMLFLAYNTTTTPVGASADDTPTLLADGRSCATTMPDSAELATAEAEFARLNQSNRNAFVDCSQEIYIPVHFHVIHKADNTGYISPADVDAQIDVLNNAFTGITFQLVTLDYTENDSWFTNMDLNSATDTAIATALGINQASELNIYTGSAGGNLGYVSCIPGTHADCAGSVRDGAFMLWTTVINGSYTNYNEGDTATHEVGHWLGLRHVWGDGGCGVDDGIADTPTSDAPNFGCPIGHQSCGTVDDITNFMDYTYDSCMDHFTTGQDDRMCSVINAYRAGIGNTPSAITLNSLQSTQPTNSTSLLLVTVVAAFLVTASIFSLRQTPTQTTKQ